MKDDDYCDLLAFYKIRSGEWVVDLSAGKIYNKFHQEVVGALTNGYRVIGTKYQQESYGIMKHRAIFIAGYGRPPLRGMQIDHIDGDKENNSIDNLREVTEKENKNNMATKWRKYGENNSNSKLSTADRIEIEQAMKGAETLSPTTRSRILKGLCDKFNVSDTTIRNIAKGGA